MADSQRGIGMPPKKIERPLGSNADEWNLFLEEVLGRGNSYLAVQIVEAIEASRPVAQVREALADALDAIFDRIEISCDWRLSSEERQDIARAAKALRAIQARE